MRKNGKKPTRVQKVRLKKLKRDPREWLVARDYPGCFEIVHRESGERLKLGA